MRFKKTRIAFSVFFGMLSLLMMGLWVRSYWWRDILIMSNNRVGLTNVKTQCGQLQLSWMPGNGSLESNFAVSSRPTKEAQQGDPVSQFERSLFHGFGLHLSRNWWAIATPIWSTISLLLATAALPYFTWRFSLRTLLIAMTAVAVSLGFIDWMARK